MAEDIYASIDNSPLISFIFYPRKDFLPGPRNSVDLTVEVEGGININCRFYFNDYKDPWILYFHGNGEVVSDYNDIASFYIGIGINIVVADYRGYGRSGGSPSFANMINDAHVLLKQIKKELKDLGCPDIPWVMGRSLGSIPAMELAYSYPAELEGLIIESGFLSASRLLKHLGIPSLGLDLKSLEEESFKKIKSITIPALIIHGERDNLIPVQEGKDLYNNLGSTEKELVIISGADHNDIMFVGQEPYFEAINNFVNT